MPGRPAASHRVVSELSSGGRRAWLLALAAAALAAGLSGEARAATTLKFGTLLPQNSPWGRSLKKWAAGVATDTGDDLQIDFQWNGQAGDEALMVQRSASGSSTAPSSPRWGSRRRA